MAQIDLSKLNIPIADMPRGQQLFSGEGQKSYEALANVTQNVGNIAVNLYNKQRDVDTDREAQDAWFKLDEEVAAKKAWAIENVDPNTNLVKGTNEGYSAHISNFRASKSAEYEESLSDNLSKGKFGALSKPKISQDNISDLYTGIALTKKNVLTGTTKKVSSLTDRIYLSSAASVDSSYKSSIDEFDIGYPTLEKTIGLGPATTARNEAMASFLLTKLETTLRNADTLNPTDSKLSLDSFSRSLGPSLGMKDFGEYSKIVQTKIDMSGINDGTAEGKKLYDSLMEDLIGKGMQERYKTIPPDKNAELLSPTVKNDLLNKFLDKKFKVAKKGHDSVESKIADFNAAFPSRGGSDEHVNALINIISNEHFPGDLATVIKLIKTGADKDIEKDAFDNFVLEGNKSPEELDALILEKRKLYEDRYITAIVKSKSNGSKEDAERLLNQFKAEMDKDPYLGKKSLEETKARLLEKAEIWRTQMNNDPFGTIMKVPEVSSSFNDAFVLKDGILNVSDDKAASWLATKNKLLKGIDTSRAAIDSTNLMPAKQAEFLFDQISTTRPEQQIQSYKNLNKLGSDAAYSFYKQAIEKGKISPEQASLFMGMSSSDSATRDAYNSRRIAILSKYTREDERENLVSKLSMQGRFGGEFTYDDIQKEAESLIKTHPLLKKMSDIARASQVSDTQISLMYNEKMLKWSVLDALRGGELSIGLFEKGMSGRVSEEVDKAVNELFNVKAINTPSLKIVIPENSALSPDEVTKNSETAIENLKNGLYDGKYKIDFSTMSESVRGKVLYKTDASGKIINDSNGNPIPLLSQDTLQTVFLKENMENLAFVSSDATGRSSDIYLMSKTSNGSYVALNLLDLKGNPGLVKITPNGLASESFNKNMGKFNHPVLLGDIPRGFKATPVKGTGNLETRKYVPTSLKEEQDRANRIAGKPLPIGTPAVPTSSETFRAPLSKGPAEPSDDIVLKFTTTKGRDDFRSMPYQPSPSSRVTIGYGHEIKPGEKFDYPMLEKKARELLSEDLLIAKKELKKDLKVKLNSSQFAALQDLYFATSVKGRIGTMALVNAGKFKEAADNMRKLVYSGDLKMKGLVRRANDRADLFEKGK